MSKKGMTTRSKTKTPNVAGVVSSAAKNVKSEGKKRSHEEEIEEVLSKKPKTKSSKQGIEDLEKTMEKMQKYVTNLVQTIFDLKREVSSSKEQISYLNARVNELENTKVDDLNQVNNSNLINEMFGANSQVNNNNKNSVDPSNLDLNFKDPLSQMNQGEINAFLSNEGFAQEPSSATLNPIPPSKSILPKSIPPEYLRPRDPQSPSGSPSSMDKPQTLGQNLSQPNNQKQTR